MKPGELPPQYLENMQRLLQDDFEDFVRIYSEPPARGLCFNKTKVRPGTVQKLTDLWHLSAVGWCSQGRYYGEDLRPGLSPYHDAGVFYIQEPSAMAAVVLAGLKGDESVLDLCAAPGGKSAQLGPDCALLVSNDPILSRARILSSNMERMGFANSVVTSAYPGALSACFEGWFDVCLVDAPCSGEGMMRRDSDAVLNWSQANIDYCVKRQATILDFAAHMLRPGGKLIYSTCTFERAENEGQVQDFLLRHREFGLLKEQRIWPHLQKGEGAFCAVLKKEGDAKPGSKDISTVTGLLKKNKIHVLRSGIKRGESRTNRKGQSFYIPSHAEALAREFSRDTGAKINFVSDEAAYRYLLGESFDIGSLADSDYEAGGQIQGFVTVYYDRYPLGNARVSGTILKNLYPKGLRRRHPYEPVFMSGESSLL